MHWFGEGVEINRFLKLRLFAEMAFVSWAGMDFHAFLNRLMQKNHRVVLKATCGLISSHTVDWAYPQPLLFQSSKMHVDVESLILSRNITRK